MDDSIVILIDGKEVEIESANYSHNVITVNIKSPLVFVNENVVASINEYPKEGI